MKSAASFYWIVLLTSCVSFVACKNYSSTGEYQCEFEPEIASKVIKDEVQPNTDSTALLFIELVNKDETISTDFTFVKIKNTRTDSVQYIRVDERVASGLILDSGTYEVHLKNIEFPDLMLENIELKQFETRIITILVGKLQSYVTYEKVTKKRLFKKKSNQD